MKTSQIKKGNSHRKAKWLLREKRFKAEEKRRKEAGLPSQILPAARCRWCDRYAPQVTVVDRGTGHRTRTTDCCRGA